MKRIFYVIVFLFLGSIVAKAQTSKTDPVDGEGWYSVTLKADLPKKWEASLQYEARFWNNLQNYYGSYVSLGANRKMNKHLDLCAEYRMAFFDDGITYRYTLGGEASTGINKKINVAGRLLFQNRVQDEYDPTLPTDATIFWRVRGQIKWEASKKIDLYSSIETIMEIGGNSFVDNWRNIVGVKYKFNKKTKLDLWYMYRPDYGKSTYNRLFHVLGFNLSYRLKVQ